MQLSSGTKHREINLELNDKLQTFLLISVYTYITTCRKGFLEKAQLRFCFSELACMHFYLLNTKHLHYLNSLKHLLKSDEFTH